MPAGDRAALSAKIIGLKLFTVPQHSQTQTQQPLCAWQRWHRSFSAMPLRQDSDSDSGAEGLSPSLVQDYLTPSERSQNATSRCTGTLRGHSQLFLHLDDLFIPCSATRPTTAVARQRTRWTVPQVHLSPGPARFFPQGTPYVIHTELQPQKQVEPACNYSIPSANGQKVSHR